MGVSYISLSVLEVIMGDNIYQDIQISIPLKGAIRASIDGKEYRVKGGSKLFITERLQTINKK